MADTQLPITIVQGMIDASIEKAAKAIQVEMQTKLDLMEARFKKIEDALGLLDKDFRDSNRKKPFSLGFLDFDME